MVLVVAVVVVVAVEVVVAIVDIVLFEGVVIPRVIEDQVPDYVKYLTMVLVVLVVVIVVVRAVVDIVLVEDAVRAKVIKDQDLHYVKYLAGSADNIGSSGSNSNSYSRGHCPEHRRYCCRRHDRDDNDYDRSSRPQIMAKVLKDQVPDCERLIMLVIELVILVLVVPEVVTVTVVIEAIKRISNRSNSYIRSRHATTDHSPRRAAYRRAHGPR